MKIINAPRLTCKCGCTFEYEQNDIYYKIRPFSILYYNEVVACPNCGKEFVVGKTVL